MKATLTTNAPRTLASGAIGTPNTQPSASGPKSAKAHGQRGGPRRRDLGREDQRRAQDQRQHHQRGGGEHRRPGVGLPERAAEEERPVRRERGRREEERARDRRVAAAQQHQRRGDDQRARERQHAPREGRRARARASSRRVTPPRSYATGTREPVPRRHLVHARDEADRPDAAQGLVADAQQAIAELHARRRGEDAGPEAAHAREVRSVARDPRRTPGPRRAGRAPLDARAGRRTSSRGRARTRGVRTSAARRRRMPASASTSHQAAGARNWIRTLKRTTVASVSPVWSASCARRSVNDQCGVAGGAEQRLQVCGKARFRMHEEQPVHEAGTGRARRARPSAGRPRCPAPWAGSVGETRSWYVAESS